MLKAYLAWQTDPMAIEQFNSAYHHGFARVAACTLPLSIADPAENAARIITQAQSLHADAVAVAVFQELGLSGYAIDDLVMQDVVLDGVLAALAQIAEASAALMTVLVVGAPLRHRNRLYNCAVVIHRGRILGVAPKSYLPTYREFYERRHFAAGDDQSGQWISIGEQSVPFGPDLLFAAIDVPGLVVHAEVCEDMWVPVPPSSLAALAGATVLLNLSGSPITVARAEDRHLLCRSASSRCLAAYVYAAAGEGESTTDLSWDGQTMIYENGDLLAETARFALGPQASIADIDVDRLRQDRLRQGTFDDNRRTHSADVSGFRTIALTIGVPTADIGLRRPVDRFPFVPDDQSRLAQDCYEAYNIQVAGLTQRLRAIGNPKVVIGVSGGLDSTQALLVAARAMDRLDRPRTDILAYTMPGFATTEHTRSNAEILSRSLGVSFEQLDIRPAARQLLADLDHPFARGEKIYDVTFENVQAGLRTDYLFRLANQLGGIVLGTGDLSELSLGWCTYGVGDQMSHYTVNSGIPKTLIQHLIRWVIAEDVFTGNVEQVLQSILDTEITPELVPTKDGAAPQSTEAAIGPYSLQDFNLFYVLRYGFRPSKIAYLSSIAWGDTYDLATIRQWLEVFIKRYFAFSQFKRSALPNGPKVSSGGSLSPRGDWRMPSDANATAWLAELDREVPRQ